LTQPANSGSANPSAGGNTAGQVIKWTVYGLLLVNFGFYFLEELEFARHTMRTGGSLIEWTTAFATTADELAWFGLLFLFELETYTLSDEALKPWLQRSFHVLRLLCYLFLAHTIYAWGEQVYKVENISASPEYSSLCEMTDQELSFTRNYEYTVIDPDNCKTLAEGEIFYRLEPTVFTDASGLVTEKRLAWVDLVEASAWLLIVLTIELGVRLQERSITGGRLMMISFAGKALYGLLFAAAAYWAYKGHWFYTWDELLWIGGFFAIELNMKIWREEIADQENIEAAAI
jgi:hypothetical protein